MVSKAFGRVGICAVAGLLAAALTAPAAAASGFELSLNDGLVTIRAQEAQITDILAEWGRVGNTAIIDADELVGKTVTIELVDMPEAKALRTLLRSASGYIAAPRGTKSVGVSRFDRILILATSKPAARVATAASPSSAVTSATTAGGAFGQRLRVVAGVSRGRTPFAVSPEQQEQLDQLQQLLQQPDGPEAAARQPAELQGVVGTLPAARRGIPMGTADPSQGTVSVPTGAFGSTTVPETSGRSETTIPIPRP
jgi:type II secretory pathway component GspD/PulD (secretin)